jgi:hypothetical protein
VRRRRHSLGWRGREALGRAHARLGHDGALDVVDDLLAQRLGRPGHLAAHADRAAELVLEGRHPVLTLHLHGDELERVAL